VCIAKYCRDDRSSSCRRLAIWYTKRKQIFRPHVTIHAQPTAKGPQR
jgi:hypothetical protein